MSIIFSEKLKRIFKSVVFLVSALKENCDKNNNQLVPACITRESKAQPFKRSDKVLTFIFFFTICFAGIQARTTTRRGNAVSLRTHKI